MPKQKWDTRGGSLWFWPSCSLHPVLGPHLAGDGTACWKARRYEESLDETKPANDWSVMDATGNDHRVIFYLHDLIFQSQKSYEEIHFSIYRNTATTWQHKLLIPVEEWGFSSIIWQTCHSLQIKVQVKVQLHSSGTCSPQQMPLSWLPAALVWRLLGERWGLGWDPPFLTLI